jgi:hypothetical protein
MITATSQSCQNPRQGKRVSMISSAISVSENSRMPLPNGWPENRSSNAPNGSPAHNGSRPGRSWRQAIISRYPIGGTTGAGDMIGSIGLSEASRIVSQGTPKASSGKWSRLILLPNASRRERGLIGSIIRPRRRDRPAGCAAALALAAATPARR